MSLLSFFCSFKAAALLVMTSVSISTSASTRTMLFFIAFPSK